MDSFEVSRPENDEVSADQRQYNHSNPLTLLTGSGAVLGFIDSLTRACNKTGFGNLIFVIGLF